MSAHDSANDPTLIPPHPAGEPQTRPDTPDLVSPTRTAESEGAGTQVQLHPPTCLFSNPGLPSLAGYVVVREIARGGMGVVYAAHDPAFDRPVAIKVMHPRQDAGRFVIESKVTAQLPHPGIPPVYALGTLPDGRPFLVMKLVEGRTLAAELKGANDTDLPRLMDIFERICQTVGFAHSRGIVHRDLKPSNVMVGTFGEVLVMDWGLAKSLGRDDAAGADHEFRANAITQGAAETVAGQVKGTPAYMAPEQARGEAVDARADVFALGGILTAILTGKPPFQADTVLNTVLMAARAELGESFARLDSCSADAELVALAKQCLTADVAKRPADAAALAQAVATYRAGVENWLRQVERARAIRETRARDTRKRKKFELALLVVAFLLIAILGAYGRFSAKLVQRDSERGMTEELAGTLARTAGYSVPAVERRLNWHVKMVEAAAEKPPPEVTAALDRLGRGPHGPRLDPAAIPAAEREAFAAWLGKVLADRKRADAAANSVASIELVLVTDADTSGAQRGFYVARAHPNGDTEHAGRTDRPDVFGRDFSFRDFFQGTGNRTDEQGKPHAVIRATHISDAYRSQGDDRGADGHRIPRPWKVDVVTPLWDAPGQRVIGLLVFGLNLEHDIVSMLEPVDLGARGSAQLGISRSMKVVLIDDRDRWVWHPDLRGGLAEDRPGQSLQHSYAQLASARGLDPVQALPWKRIGESPPGQFGYTEADDYIDLVEGAETGSGRNDDPEIACFTRFSPYAYSRYPGARARQWVFVAQVDRKTVLRPLDDLRAKIVRIGGVIGAVTGLALLAISFRIGFALVGPRFRRRTLAGDKEGVVRSPTPNEQWPSITSEQPVSDG
jgi:serine/threonine protein kinase